MIPVIVDGRKIMAAEGEPLLQACLRNEIFIPHLCFLESASRQEASCRLCFVDIEGYQEPVPSCMVPVTHKLKVQTETGRVRHLQRSALRLLLSAHPVDCRHCHANRACALQEMARFLKTGLRPGPLGLIQKSLEVDRSHPCIDLYPHRCVLCGRCIRVCRDSEGKTLLTFTGRGINTRVRHFPANGDRSADCRACGRCLSACPVGALQLRKADSDAID